MKRIFTLSTIVFSLIIASNRLSAQTTAMNFSGVDCTGNPVNLFDDLDAGHAVVLFYYMPNCGSCPPPAQKIQAMADNINASQPGKVKAYAFPYQNSTTCAYSSTWVTSNNLSLYAPMDSGTVQVAYYGGFGMPTVVLLGGSNRDVLFVTQNFTTSDTTTMRDLILGLPALSVEELPAPDFSVELFPNPSSDQVNLSMNFSETATVGVQMLDLEGRNVFRIESEIVPAGTFQKMIDVSALQNGNYLLQIQVNGKIQTQKLNVLH